MIKIYLKNSKEGKVLDTKRFYQILVQKLEKDFLEGLIRLHLTRNIGMCLERLMVNKNCQEVKIIDDDKFIWFIGNFRGQSYKG